MDAVLGIDLATAKFDVVLLTSDGKRRRKAYPNTPVGFEELVAWLRRHHVARVHATLEATGPTARRSRRGVTTPAIVSVS